MTKIISKVEQKKLLTWISRIDGKFLPNEFGPHRKRCHLNWLNQDELLPLVAEVKERILSREKICVWSPDPFLGDMVTFIEDGGYIQEHTDMTLPGREHLRFNLLLSKPLEGGYPVLEGKQLEFEERSYLRYHVNKQKHSSLPVGGDKPRIMISYGISIDSVYLR